MYQPIFDLENGRVLGVEALLRWNHPTRGVVQPDTFIPLLEETKQIVEVGRWVLNEACRQAAEWHLPERDMYVSVNVSARQLDDEHLVDDLRTALDVGRARPVGARDRDHRDRDHARRGDDRPPARAS